MGEQLAAARVAEAALGGRVARQLGLEAQLEPVEVVAVGADEADHVRAELALWVEAARLFGEADARQAEALDLLGFGRRHLALHPREAARLQHAGGELGGVEVERLGEALRGGAFVGQQARVDPDRVDVDGLRQRDAAAVEDVAAARGDLDLPHVLILREALQHLLLVDLQLKGAGHDGDQGDGEHRAHDDDAQAHPLAGRLDHRHLLEVANGHDLGS